jgi:CMP-N-acetylneuraminic acid synthetase
MIRFCSICARGGSKGVKNKNIRDMHGLPLIAHSILQARKSGLFDVISVSSDSDAILDVARTHGADYTIKRPDVLATDTAAKVPVIRHAMETAEALSGKTCDLIVDLDATSPLRLVRDIQELVNLLETPGTSNVFSVTPSRRSPYFNMVEIGEDQIPVLSKTLPNQVVRRQDAPATYDMNASIYGWTRDCLMANDRLFLPATKAFMMPEERSYDIDTPVDFRIVELLMTQEAAQ